MLDKQILEKIKKTLSLYLDPKKHKAFIFGSWATGKAQKFSDAGFR